MAIQALACGEAGRRVKVGDICEAGMGRAKVEDVDCHAIVEHLFSFFFFFSFAINEESGGWTYISPYWAKRIPISFADTSAGKLFFKLLKSATIAKKNIIMAVEKSKLTW